MLSFNSLSSSLFVKHWTRKLNSVLHSLSWFSGRFLKEMGGKSLAVGCVLLLTACGFEPLYLNPKTGEGRTYPIKISTIKDRDGQMLRNYLVDLLTPEGSPKKPKYVLYVILKDIVKSTGTNRDETTSRKKAVLTATLTLRDSKDKVVYTHTVQAVNSFAVVMSQNYYSDVVSEDFAKKEALHLLAEKIKLHLSAFLDRQDEN